MSNETNQQEGPKFMAQRLYLKDASLEVEDSPAVFLKEWKPELSMDLGTQATKLDEATREVVLTVTVTVRLADKDAPEDAEKKVAFLVEVKQAGIFTVEGFATEQEGPLLGSYCPNMLYAYAREAVTSLVMKAGFPQLYLAPVNFDALYEQHMQQQNDAEAVKN